MKNHSSQSTSSGPSALHLLGTVLETLREASEAADLCRSAAEGLAQLCPQRGIHVQLWDPGNPQAGSAAGAGPEMSADLISRPLVHAGECFGEIVTDAQPGPLQDQESALFDMVGGVLAESVRRQAIDRTLAEERRSKAWTLARVAREREGMSIERLVRFSRTCVQLAREAFAGSDSWDEKRYETFESACVLHDVGKMCVPEAILLKPSRLTPEEWRVVRSHPEHGARLIEQAAEGRREAILDMGREIALYHHERWDGSGYPHGKSENDIPVEARIVGLIDAYEALTSDRAHRPAWEHDPAYAWIRSRSGTHFDPFLVAAFERVEGELKKQRLAIRSASVSGSANMPEAELLGR